MQTINKFTRWSGFLLFTLGFPALASAQLGKAYESVYYQADATCGHFELDYGDGYIGASKIRLKIKGSKQKIAFLPDYGVPESNGDFRFHQFRSDCSIVLKSIDDETYAPDQIKGICYLQKKSYPLLFKRIIRHRKVK